MNDKIREIYINSLKKIKLDTNSPPDTRNVSSLFPSLVNTENKDESKEQGPKILLMPVVQEILNTPVKIKEEEVEL